MEKYTHEQAEKILQRLREMESEEAVRITTSEQKQALPMSASKFGGLPYWIFGEDYPRDEDGEPLYLLAQINFADVPHLPDYPERGLLQIFVQKGEPWGCDYGAEQTDWRIVWHDEISESNAMSERALREMGVKTAADNDEKSLSKALPFEKEYALSFKKIASVINPRIEGFDERVQQIAKEQGFPLFEGSSYDWFDDDDFVSFYDGENGMHQIGGFPFFTQDDVRRKGDILLFQMDSERENDSDIWKILWGDSGVANFFIAREDLKKRDFSNVLYNWDCM